MLAKAPNHQRVLLAATFALAATLTACGSLTGSEGSTERVRVIRDPDNPAFTGQAVQIERSQSIVRDPDNPYWIGSTASFDAYDEAAAPGTAPADDHAVPQGSTWLGKRATCGRR